ncbi:Hypothetical protein A7982_08083 [Minicystis rosea]|nr:Hypothetical protein A7982_08083 [Minicystis rosea]
MNRPITLVAVAMMLPVSFAARAESPSIALHASLAERGDASPSVADADAVAGKLSIVELKYFDADGLGLVLHADGKVAWRTRHFRPGKPVEVEWHDRGTLHAEGKLVLKDGKSVTLRPDGTFETSDGKRSPFKLEGDAIVSGDKRVTIDEHGVFRGTDLELRVEGAVDVETRRTALALIAMIETYQHE